MTISYIGGGAVTSNVGTTVTVTYTVTAGRCLVVLCASNTPSQTVTGITDTGGSSILSRVGPLSDSTQVVEIWSTSPTGSTSSTSITATWSDSAGRRSLIVLEFDGVTLLGNTATNSGTGTNPTVSLTTQDANNWVVANLLGDFSNVITASVGTVRQTNQSGATTSQAGMTNTSASAGSVTCTGTQAESDLWVAAALELRSVSSGSLIHRNGPTIPLPLLCM